MSILPCLIIFITNILSFSFVLEKANRKELYRVGFEEIHKIWSDITYRPAFKFVYRIASAGVPVFGTSGSLPEHLLLTLYDLTSMVWRVIRMPSNRKELAYDVMEVPKGESLSEAVIRHWEEVSQTYTDDDRCLVFCRTVKDAKQLGHLLDVLPYHRECEDDTPVQDFIHGQQKILPTTQKLGCGFHYNHIRDVLHLDLAYSVVDQYQEDSRGGRDGQLCRAITFVQEGFTCPKDDNPYDLGAKAVYEWAQKADRCRRIGPSMFLDNVPVTCSLLYGAQLCSFCSDQLSKQAPAIPRSLPMPVLPKTPFKTPLSSISDSHNQLLPQNLTTTPAPMISSSTTRYPHKQQTPHTSKRLPLPSQMAANTTLSTCNVPENAGRVSLTFKAPSTISSSATKRPLEEQTPQISKRLRRDDGFSTSGLSIGVSR